MRATALQDASRPPVTTESREASWSAPVLWRFLTAAACSRVSTRPKAAEGHRTPRRFAFAGDYRIARSVLECASPLTLSDGGAVQQGEHSPESGGGPPHSKTLRVGR